MRARSIRGEYRKRRQVQDQAERRASEVIKIDKGIPVPRRRWNQTKHPDFRVIFTEMEIGDSIAFPVDYEYKGQLKSRAAEAMRTIGRTEGFKTVIRLSEDKKSVRVWRVA